jgi:translation initiation factor 3 subunit E
MVDYAIDVYKTLHGDDAIVPDDVLMKREYVVSKLQELEELIEPVVELFEKPEVAEHMKREDQNLFDYLAQNHSVSDLLLLLVNEVMLLYIVHSS